MADIPEKTYEGHIPGLYLSLGLDSRNGVLYVGLGDRALRRGAMVRVGLTASKAREYVQDLLDAYRELYGEEFRPHERDIDADPN